MFDLSRIALTVSAGGCALRLEKIHCVSLRVYLSITQRLGQKAICGWALVKCVCQQITIPENGCMNVDVRQ